MLISKETLDAVCRGILTDIQLKEALAHYTYLERMLNPHGELYQLVWTHVVNKLVTLRNMYHGRAQDRELKFDRYGVELEMPH